MTSTTIEKKLSKDNPIAFKGTRIEDIDAAYKTFLIALEEYAIKHPEAIEYLEEALKIVESEYTNRKVGSFLDERLQWFADYLNSALKRRSRNNPSSESPFNFHYSRSRHWILQQ